MRSLQRRKQDIWITKATRNDDRIEGSITYSKPEKHRVTVSNTSGTPHELPVGIVAEYSRYFVSFDRDFHPEEGDMVFVDVVPELGPDGNLLVGQDGVPTTSPDYVVSHIMNTARGTIARYGIRRIAGEGNAD